MCKLAINIRSIFCFLLENLPKNVDINLLEEIKIYKQVLRSSPLSPLNGGKLAEERHVSFSCLRGDKGQGCCVLAERICVPPLFPPQAAGL